MADLPVVLVAILKTTTPEARSKLVGAFNRVAEYTKLHEPHAVKYAICDTADNSDLNTIYLIEEYQNQEAYDRHLATPIARDAIARLTSASSDDPNSNALLSMAPIVHELTWTQAHFTKPTLEPSQNPNPYIIWATIDFPSVSLVNEIAPYGAAVVQHALNDEPGCLFYGDARPKIQSVEKGLIAAVEVYEDEAAFQVHSQGKELQAMGVEAVKLGSKINFVGLKMEAGFLMREDPALHSLRDGKTFSDA